MKILYLVRSNYKFILGDEERKTKNPRVIQYCYAKGLNEGINNVLNSIKRNGEWCNDFQTDCFLNVIKTNYPEYLL